MSFLIIGPPIGLASPVGPSGPTWAVSQCSAGGVYRDRQARFGASVRVEEAIGRLGAGREGVVFLRAGTW